MDLPRAGREYAVWPLAGVPVDVTTGLQVSLDGAWHDVEIATDRLSCRVLVAGPDFDLVGFPYGGTVTIPTDQLNIEFRLIDNPEHIFRAAGNIRLTT